MLLKSLVFLCLMLAACGVDHKRVSTLGGFPAIPAGMADPDADQDQDSESDTPGEAAEFYLLRRTGGAPLPVEKLLQAKRHKDAMPARAVARHALSPRDANMGAWQPVGPANIGGRTRAFVIRPDDPNTMYAGAVSGGVWKTTDGGNSWNPLTDLLPSIAIATLAMDPQDPNTLYAGTGEYFTMTASSAPQGNSIRGAGVFKTTDAGATWTQLPKPPSGNSFDYTNKIVVSPNNSQHVYAANWAGIYYSPDGGNTWQSQLDRSGSMAGCQDLVIRTDQATDYLFAACSYNGSANPAIYRNVDAAGAGKWQIVFTTANMARSTLALAPSNQSIIYALVGATEPGTCPTDNSTPVACYNNGLLGVWRSTSNGDSGSWTQQVSNQDPNLLNTVLLSSPTTVFADVCGNGATKKSFSNQANYDNVIAVDPTNSNVVWVGGIDLFRSDDGGQNWGIAGFWEANPPEGSHADNHAIVFSPNYDGAGNQTLFATSDGGIYRTDNALAPVATGPRAACAPFPTQVAWTNVNNGYAVTQFYDGAVFPGAAAYIAGAQDTGTSMGSDAAGQNWARISGGDGGWVAVDPVDPNILYAEGTRSTALTFRKSTNGGGSFSVLTRGITETYTNFLFITPFVLDPAQHLRLYIGGHTLWRTSDGAANWSAASAPIPAGNGSISAIAVSPSDPNHVIFGTSTGFIFRSSAALTSDNTTVWPSVQPRTGYVSGITFDPVNPGIVYATYSQYKQTASQSHVYQSTDGGATWKGIDGSGATGIPDIPVFTLIVDPQDTASLYIGTDIGIFVSSDRGATWARDVNPFADTVTETLVLDRGTVQSNLVAFTHGRGVWKTTLPGSADACQYSLSATSATFPAFGGSVPVSVTAADGCMWSAVLVSPLDLQSSPRQSGFTISSPAGGNGNGSFSINAPNVNNTSVPKTATAGVQGNAIAVTQAAALIAKGNDDISAAFSFGAMPAVVIEDTTGATESASDPVHSCTKSADFKTVWFSLKPQTAGTLTVQFFDQRKDNGGDAGMVITVYPNVDGARGAEAYCDVIPQTAAGFHFNSFGGKVSAADSYFVEVSATTFGAPSGAKVMGGNLTLTAIVK